MLTYCPQFILVKRIFLASMEVIGNRRNFVFERGYGPTRNAEQADVLRFLMDQVYYSPDRRTVKKALAIVSVVTLYSWLASVFLLTILTPAFVPRPFPIYQAIVGWGQLMVIPGLAALFSRLMYGPKGWPRRAVKILLAGSVGVVCLLLVIIFTGAAIAWTATINSMLFVASLLVLGGGVTLGIVWIAAKIHRRSIPLEAARWLEERQRGVKPTDRKWRNRGICLAAWIPTLTGLILALFLFPIWGVLSHLAQPQVGNLTRFRVPVPLTWIVLGSDRSASNGDVWATGLVRQGAPLFAIFDPQKRMQISTWSFRFQAANDPSQPESIPHFRHGEEIIGRRQFTIGDENIECMEYLPSYWRRLDLRDSSFTLVDCGGSGRFSASFGGEKIQLSAFYRVLEGTKEVR